MTLLDPTHPSTSPPRSRASLGSTSRLSRVKALFLFAAGLSFVFSVSLWFLVDREQGLFVGLWVPSILSLGTLMLSGKREVGA